MVWCGVGLVQVWGGLACAARCALRPGTAFACVQAVLDVVECL